MSRASRPQTRSHEWFLLLALLAVGIVGGIGDVRRAVTSEVRGHQTPAAQPAGERTP